ncbi:MAG: hypothetical protein GWP18_00360 [Proteobacteria bacterium]|nr:hypothetical protein [Pseudomonadota bacterium]
MGSKQRSLFVLIYGFALLGMPGSALGVAWPSMAEELSRGLGDLGTLTIVIGASYAIVSFAGGTLTKRIPAGTLLVASAMLSVASLGVFAGAHRWQWYVAAAIPLGISGGMLDAIGNGFVAVNRGTRAMGFLHAAFGFGAMIAPLMISALFALGLSWRFGFVALSGANVLLAGALVFVAGFIRMPMQGRSGRPERHGRKRLLGLSVWTFFIYAGVEGSTGFWAFTLLTEGQGVSSTVAGVALAAHWGALFVSRVLIGIAGDRIASDATITASVLGIAGGLALVWWNPVAWVAIAGLVVAGFASGPVFPLEVLLTTGRFGEEFTPWAVGYQLSAAMASIAVIPALIGLLVNIAGPLAIAPMLVILAIVMVVSVEGLRIVAQREATVVANEECGP